MTRRRFLKVSAAAGAGAALGGAACAGAPVAGGGEVEMPSAVYGSAGPRVLVGYATRTGSTVGVAQAIGETLGGRGFRAEVVPLSAGPSPAGYEGVVLGSAVNGGAWLPEAVAYVEANAAALARVPVAVFCVHAMNVGADEKSVAARQAYLDAVRAKITPADEAWFTGRGPTPADSNFLERWLYRAFGGGCEGDCRDWDAIRAWAGRVHGKAA